MRGTAWVIGVALALPASAVISQESPAELPDTIVWRADGAAMVKVPAGEFLSGPEGDTHRLSAFFVDKYEVTCRQFVRFLNAVGREQDADGNWYLESPPTPAYPSPLDQLLARFFERVGETWLPRQEWEWRPVLDVTTEGALAYAAWAGKQVPTELEWEKAARGTDGREYPWGNEEDLSRFVTYDDTHHGRPPRPPVEPVGSRPEGASPYGAMDMFGNAQEWVRRDPRAAQRRRSDGKWLLMGIEYFGGQPNTPGVILGFSHRDRDSMSDHAAWCGIEGSWRGFRCVVSAADIRPEQWRAVTPEDGPPAS